MAPTHKSTSKPLSAPIFLWRNLGKTLPLIGVILLAVMLICGIVSMMNSIPHSIRTIYSYSSKFAAVTPRGDPDMPPKIVERAQKDSPVPIEKVILCRATGVQVMSIVGKWPFANIGLRPADMTYYIEKLGAKLSSGRLPKVGEPAAVISEPVARNLRLKIGSTLQSAENQDAYSPKDVKVVGILESSEWIMLGDYEYQRANHFPPVDGVLLFAKDGPSQTKLDDWALSAYKGERAQVLIFAELNRDTELMFRTLYRILNVVIATLVLVITIMMGMLINIHQSQRTVEFGLLQALGFTKKRLIGRVVVETLWVVVIGWAIGILVSYFLLVAVDRALMYPNAYALQTLDWQAFSYTTPVPFAIFSVGILTIIHKFRTFDPVGIVERRIV